LAPDGKKMSKRLGNIISPGELLKDYPTDAIRQLAALSGAMAKDRPFSFEDIKYAKSFLNKLWNAARFVETCGKPKKTPEEADLSMTDRWILGRMNATIKDCTGHMERFEYHYALSKLHAFFWHDFCDNYIEYVKYRIYEGRPDKEAALYTLNTVLLNAVKLLAPITPHISEEIYHEVFAAKGSIHRADWAKGGNGYDEDVAKVLVLNEIVSALRQHKSRNKMPQNAELAKVRLSLKEGLDPELINELKMISKIKELETMQGEFSVSVQ
jgi:valyl-tRNA synthetase